MERATFLVLAGVLAAVPAAGQASGDNGATAAAPVLRAARAATPVVVDGRLDEGVWGQAQTARGFVQRDPDPGAPASFPTEVRVLYDDDALYVGARLRDPEPARIVARLARRDEDVYSDWFHVAIDSYLDRRSAFSFQVNPAGVKLDVRIQDGGADPGWDPVWEAATRVDQDGWVAELRIPLSQLRFNPVERGETGRWGINFRREIARLDEASEWAPVPNNVATEVAYFGTLDGLEGLTPPRRVEVMPYGTTRLTRAPGDTNDPYFEPNDLAADAGADFKVGVTPALTLTGTLNPDFGQVEADPSVVNLTAFETFYDERRPFFVEGAEVFDTGYPRIFYSRRIGRAPQGGPPGGAPYADLPEAATILGAAKLTGRTAAGWTIGVLTAVTGEETAPFIAADGTEGSAVVEPLTSYAVARVARDFRDGRSSIGGMVTATNRKLDDAGLSFLRDRAYVALVDGRHRFGGDRYEVLGRVAYSSVGGDAAAIARTQRAPGRYLQRPDAEHLTFDPGRTSLDGADVQATIRKVAGGNWRWRSSVSVQTPGFEVNDLGFNAITDRARWSSRVSYDDFDVAGPLRSWGVDVQHSYTSTTGGERVDHNATLSANLTLDSGWSVRGWAMRHQGGIDPNVLRGGPGLINPGRYMGGFSLSSDRRREIRGSAMTYWELEDETDSHVFTAHAMVAARPSSRAELSIGPLVTWNRNDWQYITRATIGGEMEYVMGRLDQTTAFLFARLNYTFTPTLSFQLYAQPFVSAGAYGALRAVADPGAADFADRLPRYDDDQVSVQDDGDGRTFVVDADRDGTADFSVSPDFNFKQIRSTAVLRWEYSPGSTLFVVWSQDRTGVDPYGSFELGRDFGDVLAAPGRNVIAVKVSYWIGL